MIPSIYPRLEYRPITPQSDAQPEIIDPVKIYMKKKIARIPSLERLIQGEARSAYNDTHGNDRRQLPRLSPRPILMTGSQTEGKRLLVIVAYMHAKSCDVRLVEFP